MGHVCQLCAVSWASAGHADNLCICVSEPCCLGAGGGCCWPCALLQLRLVYYDAEWKAHRGPTGHAVAASCSDSLIHMCALQADVKRAYKNLAKKWHPDKHPHNQEEAKQKFQAISQAFESLMSTDEEARIEAIAAANAAAKM